MSTIEKYISLIAQFVKEEITASQFEALYLKMFKNESGILPEGAYDVLNELFLDVDAYCGDPALRGDGDLSERELLKSAARVLERLV